jgi:hypothetical protein
MTGERMIARFVKGRGWTYNIGHRVDVYPKAARDTLVVVYGLRPAEAAEKMTHRRDWCQHEALPLPARHLLPARCLEARMTDDPFDLELAKSKARFAAAHEDEPYSVVEGPHGYEVYKMWAAWEHWPELIRFTAEPD